LLPWSVAFVLWMTLQVAAFAVVFWAGLRLSGASALRERMPLATLAVLMTSGPLGWDFRNHNTNLVYLALVMLGLVTRKTWLGGLLFAASVNLKLYSGLWLAGLVWRREYRLASAMGVASLLLGIVLPVLVFGFPAYLQLLREWFEQVLYTATPSVQAAGPATLLRSVVTLLGDEPTSFSVFAVWHAAQLLWVALVIGYFAAASRRDRSNPGDQARLADVCVLLMASLPLSTWFVPYHAVVMLPALLLLLTVAVSAEWPRWARATAIVALAGCQLLRFSPFSFELRGLIYLVSFSLLVLGLGAVRLAIAQAAKGVPAGVIPMDTARPLSAG
jgi:hypothetical protein